MKRRHDYCKERELSTGYPQGGVDFSDGLADDPDLMDPPDLFEGLYDDDAYEARMPQERRSGGRPALTTGGVPAARIKDPTVQLPDSPVMFDALRVAQSRGDVVTSGREGHPGDRVHAPTSQHYRGTAIDVRYAGDRRRQVSAYAQAGYVVVPEATHLHVQRYAVA